MNYEIRQLLAKEKAIHCKFVISWEERYYTAGNVESYINSQIKHTMAEQIMQELNPVITKQDTPEDQEFSTYIYAFDRTQMLKLLEDAYNKGAMRAAMLNCDNLVSYPCSGTAS